MATDTGGEHTPLSPENAFSVLGNETRMEILQTLGEADAPLSFSELRERVEWAIAANSTTTSTS